MVAMTFNSADAPADTDGHRHRRRHHLPHPHSPSIGTSSNPTPGTTTPATTPSPESVPFPAATPHTDAANWRMSVDVDLPAAEAVLQGFFDHVHIFNPILEEEDVRDYIRRVRFDGIGWDSVSCLVVRTS